MKPTGRQISQMLLLLVCFSGSSQAGKLPLSIDLEIEGISYSDEIPTPEKVLGHMVGTRHSAPHQIVAYFDRIGEVSDRVKVGLHGSTYENRPLVHPIITSAANHARLEQLRLANLRLSDNPSEVTDEQIQELPAIVTMGYSVHGNEASGSEAAMLLLYQLAVAEQSQSSVDG